MAEQSILPIIHPEAFYGNPGDVPDRPVVFAGLEFKVPSSAVGNLPLFTRDNVPGVVHASATGNAGLGHTIYRICFVRHVS